MRSRQSKILFFGFLLAISLPAVFFSQAPEKSENEKLADTEFEQGMIVRFQTILAVKSVPWETSVERYRTAIARFTRARDLYHQAGNRRNEANSLWRLAELQKLTDETESARKNLDEAIRIYEEIGDKLEAGKRKTVIGDIYLDAGDYDKAIYAYNEGLTAAREMKDPTLEAESLTMIGLCYSKLFNRPEAISYWEQSLKVSEKAGNKMTSVATLEMLGKSHVEAAEREKAIRYYSRALLTLAQPANHQERLRFSGLTDTAADLLIGLGNVRLGIEMLNRGVAVDRLLGLKQQEGNKLVKLGEAYRSIGDAKNALQVLEEALTLSQALKAHVEEALVMMQISSVYRINLHSKEKALEFAERALKIAKESGDVACQSNALIELGEVVSTIPGREAEEIEYRKKALELYRSLNDPEGAARLTEGIGIAYYRAKDFKNASGYLNEALMTYVVLGLAIDMYDPLYWLQQTWRAAGNPKLAIAYGKEGIKSLQAQRKLIANVDVASQRTYLASVEKAYRTYVAFLFEQNRLTEAHQALTAFKDQQSFDVVSTPEQRHSVRLSGTPRENRFWTRYIEFFNGIIRAKRTGQELRHLVATRPPTPEETEKIKAADDAQSSAWLKFYDFVYAAQSEFAKPADKDDEVPLIAENESIRKAIRDVSAQTQQGTVAIYQMVSDDKIDFLIVTQDETRHVRVPVSGVNERARTFWALLQSDKYDPRPLGKELYEILFRPIEKQLPSNTKTIHWSLDGNVRYVPIAALYDGKQYLVERYNNVMFTRADGEQLTRAISPTWSATAFGGSKPHTVENLGEKTSFSALPGVSNELNTVFVNKTKPVMDSDVLVDEAFTRDAMLKKLAAKRPVVHIASHFSFRPGDESRSFLLMGDGTPFTLSDMKNQKEMFAGVELLTLSACNTAAQQADANGREVDAFFELAQRLGAQSVLATLWPVADNSTPWLMREFYDLKVNKKQNKAEALRNAQLALLNGSAKTSRSTVRSDASQVKIVVEGESKPTETVTETRAEKFTIAKKDAKPFIPDLKRPFAHPFYWSPFVLIGNWR
jgi:CHAT domain-containing protein/tetratricopeptide (TPR) repeat protein